MTRGNIVLGITGSIAAYKAADIASRLIKAGYEVDVVMTDAAREFISPMTLQAITQRPVVTEMFTLHSEMAVEHVALAQKASVLLIAPASANTIAKIAHGMADNMLTCTALATRAPIVIAPAMNTGMYENPATRENLRALKSRGAVIVEPGEGRLACGTAGKGRLADPEDIIDTVKAVLGRQGDLAGRRILVTAGGTQEPIDPVRHITNRSSGKMGYAIAIAARDRGAAVDLITAPSELRIPKGINVTRVRTAKQMLEAVEASVSACDALVMAAAVSDYRVAAPSEHKIKKSGNTLTLTLVKNPDILASVNGTFVKVGFAAESQDLLANAASKLKAKGLDLIVANDITATGSGFEVETNQVTLLYPSGEAEQLPLMNKADLAHVILDRVANLLNRCPVNTN